MITEDYSDISKNFHTGELLWHYTGFSGLEGILEGAMWASSAFFLNDKQESRYAVDIARDVLQQESTAHPGVFDEVALSVENFFRRFDGRGSFVAAFSKKGDDLSQRRGYGSGGPSFAIGFDPRRLSTKARESKFYLHRILYGRVKFEEVFRAGLYRRHEIRERSTEFSDPEVHVTLGFEIIAALVGLAVQCKHDSFESEDEWRLVRRNSGDLLPRLPLKFRVSGSLVVPYLEIPLHESPAEDSPADGSPRSPIQSPIVAINIGPSPHPDALEYAVREMTVSKGLYLKIGRSTTPFRNW